MQFMERTTVCKVLNGWKVTGTAKSIRVETGLGKNPGQQPYEQAFVEEVENLGSERWEARQIFMQIRLVVLYLVWKRGQQ